MSARGFTLLELLLVLGTLAVLALIAAGSYRLYIVRAQAAQTLVNVDQITTVVRVENRLDNPDLEVDAKAGSAPPKLKGTLPDQAFVGRPGVTLTMIKAPAGIFASYKDKSTYALVVSGSADAAMQLAAVRWGLSRDSCDMPWLDAASFAFPIEAIATAAAAAPPDLPPDGVLPPCDPKHGKGKNWCWCRGSDGTKVKQPC
jgi:prepilin-type N-terminal cleavage/methylation domain-containing protein